ncbi:MAG: alpha/beta fold hydrolase [Acidobacteria bacterium]|nr:alpha/beta fold hydrolase [Acidobacteriota bacterium]
MRSAILNTAGVLGILYVLVCLALFLLQRSLLYHPRPRSEQAGATLLELQSAGERIQVTVVERAGPDALVYFGGNAEDVSWNVPEFRTAFPAQSIYLMHYRGYGGSSGQPGEEGIVADAFALVDRVLASHANVVVLGRSLGSGVAIRVASERPVKRLVLITPYDSVLGLGSALFPWIPVRWLLRDKYESNIHAPRVTAPVLIIAAEHDEIIPRWSSELLRTRFRTNIVQYAVVAKADHNSISDNAEYWHLMEFARPGAYSPDRAK